MREIKQQCKTSLTVISSGILDQSKYLLLVFFVFMSLCGCNSGSGSDKSEPAEQFQYDSLSVADLQQTTELIQDRNLIPEEVSMVYQQSRQGSYGDQVEVRIYQYKLSGRVSYGAVVLPADFHHRQLPVAMRLAGLNQEDPEVKLDIYIEHSASFNMLMQDHIIIVPAFRGNHFELDETYASAGNFCDAFDGAADDSIALLNLVEQEIPQANTAKVLATGFSRGGNVALLADQRDNRIAMAIAITGPTDFYRQSVADMYQDQYLCQFLVGKNNDESKLAMLASSPVHFITHSSVVRIHHGTADTVVPIWNATQLQAP